MYSFKIFISYAREDLEKVYPLYRLLKKAGYEPWLDKEKLLPGQDWDLEIKKAIKQADIFLACISKKTTSKTGYLQSELKKALVALDMQPEGRIYLIPVRLEECSVPSRFEQFQWCDFFRDVEGQSILKAITAATEERGLAGVSVEVLEGPDQGKTFRIFSSVMTIGRASVNDVCLTDNKVSSLHAKIELRNTKVLFHHLSDTNFSIIESKNGAIRLDAKKNVAPLDHDDVILIGQSKIKVNLANSNQIKELPPTENEPSFDSQPNDDELPTDDPT